MRWLWREYAIYRGFTLQCTRYWDANDTALLATDNSAVASELGFTRRLRDIFVADVPLQSVSATYSEKWWGDLDGHRVAVHGESDQHYSVATATRRLAEKWGLSEVERGGSGRA